MDGRAGRTEGEGAKTGELIGHLSQTTSPTGEGKYGSRMQAEPPLKPLGCNQTLSAGRDEAEASRI
jgi:hypothetical protein